ncbi:hypothetical protein C6P46_003005 [Rhodotorula mucilaginosa]|uniref:Proteophosphoglycan ppg4 n=1 Tax=Rhodotorula mucilaginosa TaxID=5537 RepID=A0A9P6W5S2_RHOMI|nr:hypothetical protein C6P46_003005 [Rhodotorula mucilaginosa]
MPSLSLLPRQDWTRSSRCSATIITGLHAHLVGGTGTNQTDLAPSAILSVLSFVAIVAVGWRYRQYRAHAILVVAVGCFCLGVAFALHASIANTSPAHRKLDTLAAEQTFFLFALTFLLWGQILTARTFVTRASWTHWPSTVLTFAAVMLLVPLIVGTVAFTGTNFRLATAGGGQTPLKYSQMRVASATLELVATVLTAILIPLAKVVAPELPSRELGLLDLSAWCLFVPALCTIIGVGVPAERSKQTDQALPLFRSSDLFCIAAITDDSSPLTFFYLSFGFFTLLSVALLLAVPLPQWGFGLPARNLVGTRAPEVQEAADADAWAEEARLREVEEARLLRKAKDIAAAENEARGRYDDWSLNLH